MVYDKLKSSAVKQTRAKIRKLGFRLVYLANSSSDRYSNCDLHYVINYTAQLIFAINQVTSSCNIRRSISVLTGEAQDNRSLYLFLCLSRVRGYLKSVYEYFIPFSYSFVIYEIFSLQLKVITAVK